MKQLYAAWLETPIKKRDLTLLLLLTIAFIAVNIIWIWSYRNGQPLNIDEAGYLSFALHDYRALVTGGVTGWIGAVEGPTIQAPLTTALTSLSYLVAGVTQLSGYLTIIAFGAGLIWASYYLADAIGGRQLAWLTAISVACSPAVLNYSRDYIFAIPAAAVTTLALLSLYKAQGFRHAGWVIVFGISVGLMPLARTMTIAFVPGLVLAAIISLNWHQDDRLRRTCVLGLSLVLSLLVAAIWLVPNENGLLVWHYLTSYGYGSHVAEYASSHSVASIFRNLANWLPELQQFSAYIYLPQLLMAAVGIALTLYFAIKLVVAEGWNRGILRTLTSRVLPVVVVLLGGSIALTSSQNKGSAFVLPLIPVLFIAAGWGVTRAVSRGRWLKLVFIWAFVGTSVMSSAPLLALSLPTAQTWTVDLPVLGYTVVTSGLGPIEQYELAGGYSSRSATIPVPPSLGTKWVAASRQTANELSQLGGTSSVTAFGFRNFLYNVNTIGFEQLLIRSSALLLTQVPVQQTGNTVPGYEQWLLHGGASGACRLLTAAGTQGDIAPVVTSAYMVAAARDAGFVAIDRWTLPGGREVTLWLRGSSCAFTDSQGVSMTFRYRNSTYVMGQEGRVYRALAEGVSPTLVLHSLSAWHVAGTLGAPPLHSGELVRVAGSPSVYLVRAKQLVPIPSAAVFTAHHFSWNAIVLLPGLQWYRNYSVSPQELK